METPKQRYPVGKQDFPKLRGGGYEYVDKTDLIYDMTHGDSDYIFLSRPRRFGKSLLVSTLKTYFEGRKELFKGLALERLETEWTKYPVLLFSMSQGRCMNETRLEEYLMSLIDDCEKDIGVKADGAAPNIRLRNLTRATYEKTGQKVVVLVDEYDTPLLYQSGYLTINGFDEADGYLLEIPNNEVRAGLAQINEMGYADGFANMGLPPVVKIGININPDTRTINDWVIERA